LEVPVPYKHVTYKIPALWRLVRRDRLDPECSPLEGAPERPASRADCKDAERPCPWVGCRYHLWADFKPSGTVVVLKDVEPWDMPAESSCALDVADRVDSHGFPTRGPDALAVYEHVANILGVSRQRVQQRVEEALDSYFVALSENERFGAKPGGD